VTPDGVSRVVYAASNGHIIELRLQGEWIEADLSALVTNGAPAPPAVSAPFAYWNQSDQVPRVVYAASNGDIIELRLQGDISGDPPQWLWADLSALVTDNSPPAPPSASAPFAYVNQSDQVPRVVYAATNRDIIELRLQGEWYQAYLSEIVTNGPPTPWRPSRITPMTLPLGSETF
jgi:hypothetical protein